MAKEFEDLKSACNWLKDVIDACANDSLRVIAEQLYKDSDKYTYRAEGHLYDSGASNSEFAKGYVIERTPYARRRYFEGGKPGENKQAQPLWFEVAWNEHKNDYENMCINVFGTKKKK